YTYGTLLQLQQTVDSLRRERRELAAAHEQVQAGALSMDQMSAIGSVRSSPDLLGVIGNISRAEAELRALLVTNGPEARAVQNKQFEIAQLKSSTLPIYVNAVLNRIDTDLADRERRINNTRTEMRSIPTRTLTEQKLLNDLMLARS